MSGFTMVSCGVINHVVIVRVTSRRKSCYVGRCESRS